jgi:hypothetical protein
MKPPTIHPERRHCLGCRHLQPVAGVLDCLELVSWRRRHTAECAVQGSGEADAALGRQAAGRGVTGRIARACARGSAPPPETFAKPNGARVSGFLQGNNLRKLPDDFGKIF